MLGYLYAIQLARMGGLGSCSSAPPLRGAAFRAPFLEDQSASAASSAAVEAQGFSPAKIRRREAPSTLPSVLAKCAAFSQHVFDFLDFALTLLRRRLPPKAHRDHGGGKIAGDVRRRGLVPAEKWR